MRRMYPVAGIILMVWLAACSSSRPAATNDDGLLETVLIQVNDVYEIAPLSGGKEGGVARVATLKKEWLHKNPNTELVIAGDFLSPSVYNSLRYNDHPIRGKQMVEALNAAGMDIAVFGNHEFDIKEEELQERINESDFSWLSSNVFHKTETGIVPFIKTTQNSSKVIPATIIRHLTDADGTEVKIGFINATLPFNKAGYVSYQDPFATAVQLYNRIKDSVDAVIAITHQLMEEDIRLAQALPSLALIIGGHEHDMRFAKEGNVYITKAHANAKSAYVIQLSVNKKTHAVTVSPGLVMLNDSIAIDSITNLVVQKWVRIAENNYSSLGFDASHIVLQNGEPLDGREGVIRSQPTNLTKLVAAAMLKAAPQASVAFFNAGSVRVDDILHMPVTEYDIIRSLPFGGGIQVADMKGALLKKILTQGQANKGNGGYLVSNDAVQYDPAKNSWLLLDQPITDDKVYTVAITDFLLSGKEANLDYLEPKNPGILKIYPAPASGPLTDIRLAIIQYLSSRK